MNLKCAVGLHDDSNRIVEEDGQVRVFMQARILCPRCGKEFFYSCGSIQVGFFWVPIRLYVWMFE